MLEKLEYLVSCIALIALLIVLSGVMLAIIVATVKEIFYLFKK